MDSKIVGERIKGIMTIRNIGRKEMAEKIGISYNTLTKKLNGKREFTYSEILKIKEILKLNTGVYASILFDIDFMLEKNK